jgi:prevent-host-death family protein
MAEVSAREFNKDVSAAKRAAAKAPVIITDRGRPSHVLLSIADYRRLLADERSIADWLSVDDGVDLETGPLGLDLEAPEL